MDNEITVMEARCIDDLGYNGPNSDTFWDSVKAELAIDARSEDLFDFTQKGSTPRVTRG